MTVPRRITVTTFLDDDPAYEAWYVAHHGQYALNVNPDDARAPGMTTLHCIPCGHIGRESTRLGRRLTRHAKVTGNCADALWRLAPTFGFPQRACRDCGARQVVAS